MTNGFVKTCRIFCGFFTPWKQELHIFYTQRQHHFEGRVSFYKMATASISKNSSKRFYSTEFDEDGTSPRKKLMTDKDNKMNKKSKGKKIERKAKIVAMDCEMVGVGECGKRNALARCSIVDYNGQILYDQFVQPEEKVTDYRTKCSGVRPEHLEDAVPFQVVRSHVKKLLENRTIIGHSLEFDFKVLQLCHSDHQIRDTANYVPLRKMAGLSLTKAPSLKNLTHYLLNMQIQVGEHSSVEDARAALGVYKMVEYSWEGEIRKGEISSLSKFLEDEYWPE